MAVSKTKKRLILVYQMLMNETDESHILSANDIMKRLKNDYEIDADRRSIYSDIATLADSGVDIMKVMGAEHGYFVGNRKFELPELKVLIDAVQVSRFITKKKSKKMIEGLTSMVSKYEAQQLKKQVTLASRPKAKNETIFYNIDVIHTAIYQKKQITFQYAQWTVDKKYRLRKDGRLYQVSPLTLVWDDENYYLNAYDPDSDMQRIYRVDKMLHVEETDLPIHKKDVIGKVDSTRFGKATFGMFGGEEKSVILSGNNDMVGVIIDRFGSDISVIPADPEHFRVTVPVVVSQQFFGWLTALGGGVRITGPEQVVTDYKKYLKEIMKAYQ